MRCSVSRMLLIGVLLAVFGWPREAILGTYGSYSRVRPGYTVAVAINVGSYSEPEHEAEVFAKRESMIDAQVKPQLPIFDHYFKRVLTKTHPYAGWLGALDQKRETSKQWDYQSQLPGPVPKAPKSDLHALSLGDLSVAPQ